MALRLTQKEDIKIFLLYLLLNVGKPIDLVTLNDIVMEDEFIERFDMMDCLCDLVEAGAVEKRDAGNTSFYRITPAGVVAAKTLQSTLLRQIREKSVRSAMQLLRFKNRGAKATSRIEDLPDGRARFCCAVADAGGAFMETSLVLESRHQAELLKLNFDENAEFVYRGMLGLFSGDVNYLAAETEEE